VRGSGTVQASKKSLRLDVKSAAVFFGVGGVVGWLAVAARVLTKKRKGHERVDHLRIRELTIRSDRPEEVQLDGDTIGKARALSARVDPHSLVVRVG